MEHDEEAIRLLEETTLRKTGFDTTAGKHIRLRLETDRYVQRFADTHKCAYSKAIEIFVLAHRDRRGVKDLSAEDLDRCTDILCAKLDDPVKEILDEIARDYHLPLWQVFLGVIRLAYERSEISAFLVDPGWLAQTAIVEPAICKRCQEAFLPSQIGQIYCCNGHSSDRKTAPHSSECHLLLKDQKPGLSVNTPALTPTTT